MITTTILFLSVILLSIICIKQQLLLRSKTKLICKMLDARDAEFEARCDELDRKEQDLQCNMMQNHTEYLH